MAEVTLHHGDCLDILRDIPDFSIDAVVTDPPYSLSFMGREWDSHETPAGFQAWCQLWATECLRVLKPGGHLLAFGGTRTWHRLACAVEDAGFEVRDSIAWLYGSGFPKSLDVSKAIDKAAGVERTEVIGSREARHSSQGSYRYGNSKDSGGMFARQGHLIETTAPATDAAEQWQGWGTALKPAFEPVVVARKPLAGTVAANVLAHGTGALNIAGCRIGNEERVNSPSGAPGANNYRLQGGDGRDVENARRYAEASKALPPTNVSGRWPANVVLDESQAEVLDEQSGESRARIGKPRGADSGDGWGMTATGAEYDDLGGASRFFYVAREDNESCPNPELANTAEPTTSQRSAPADSAPSDAATSAHLDTDRPTGSPSTNGTPSASRPTDAPSTPTIASTASESSPVSPHARPTPTDNPANSAEPSQQTDTTTTTTSPSTSAGCADPATSGTMPSSVPGVPLDELGSRFTYVAKADASERVRVDGIAHPTVKPLALMRWLVRLVTPPGGTVLEPFAGSGTTVEACILEGFQCVAIEREADYLPLIVQRINRRRDPVAAVKATGDDGGLFDLLGNEETA